MHQEFQNLLSEYNLEVKGDIDELISLKQIVLITLKSKIKGLVKYRIQELYLKPDLLPLIEQISRSLSLLNLVDKTLGIQMWHEAFDTALSTYFFYFLFVFKDYFESWIWQSTKPHAKISQFELEVQRLTEFFGTFVKGYRFEQVALRSKMMVEYLRSDETQAAMGFLRSLISTGSVKSYQSLVGRGYLEICNADQENSP